MAQLSQYIVQHLRESILVVDPHDRIRLINESAAEILGDTNAYPEALIGEASPRLLYLLEHWRRGAGEDICPAADATFAAADGARLIRAHFAPLGFADGGPVLIFLEDTSLIEQRVQQSKLAALGRLSASIAHEIRNPVGAMSHAGQLLAESPTVSPMTVDSPRSFATMPNASAVSLTMFSAWRAVNSPAWSDCLCRCGRRNFTRSSAKPCNGRAARLAISATAADVEVRVDPGQLRQIIWNLCDNAIKHAMANDPDSVSISGTDA